MIRSIFENREDTKTRVTLVYCNHSRHHIIGLNQLEPMIQYYPTRITIHHVLTLGDVDDQKELEQFTLGRLDKSLLEKILSSMIPNGATPPNRSIGVLHCGPPNFDLIVGKALVELGFLKEQIYLF
jgi:ferredoxin-NADP reductase